MSMGRQKPRTGVGWAVLLVSLVALTACTGGSTSSTSSEPKPTMGGVARSTEQPVIGLGDHPTFTVTRLRGWITAGSYVMNNTQDLNRGFLMSISVWDVGEVARNPCHSIGHLYDPGPTVEDLAAALAAQPMRNASKPVGVTLAGYSGEYIEWSVPGDMVVSDATGFAGCDVALNGFRDFVSWYGNGGEGERLQQVAGQVDQLWILNVNGQRLVVDATHSRNATPAQLEREGQLVQSLRFVPSS